MHALFSLMVIIHSLVIEQRVKNFCTHQWAFGGRATLYVLWRDGSHGKHGYRIIALYTGGRGILTTGQSSPAGEREGGSWSPPSRASSCSTRAEPRRTAWLCRPGHWGEPPLGHPEREGGREGGREREVGRRKQLYTIRVDNFLNM